MDCVFKYEDKNNNASRKKDENDFIITELAMIS